ncbi:hypothetical protein QC761_0110830 [Podospora bellae-mahoneyi]|uniref:Uncharacterized protein n=1 Tax=Podospora bellae-mahoneyi TaxID=2093777 RepID=A0ABR0F9R7_9PEZI|nr:hypothetical protein QC761_0110830 [Podospora bellae-mahoneyi]
MLLAVALADPHPINPRSSTSIVQRRTQVFLLLSLFIVVCFLSISSSARYLWGSNYNFLRFSGSQSADCISCSRHVRRG